MHQSACQPVQSERNFSFSKASSAEKLFKQLCVYKGSVRKIPRFGAHQIMIAIQYQQIRVNTVALQRNLQQQQVYRLQGFFCINRVVDYVTSGDV